MSKRVILLAVTLLMVLGLVMYKPLAVQAGNLADNVGAAVDIPPQFEQARNFSEGLAAVQKDGMWGFVDKTGILVVKPQYEGAKDFSEGLAAVKQGGSWGYIDKSGTMVIRPRFVYAESFSDGFAPIYNIDLDMETSFYGRADYAIDRSGNQVSVSQLKSRKLKDGLKAFYKEGLWGFADEVGNLVIEARYQDVQDFSEGLAAVKKDGSWGFIDKTGKEVLEFRYDKANSFSEGLAGVQQDFLWSFIDKTGNKVIQGEYFGAGNFQKGLAIVYMSSSKLDMYGSPVLRYGIIDKSGNRVVEPNYDGLYPDGALFKTIIVTNPNFSGYMGEVFGYLDRSGKEILAPQCNFSTSTDDGLLERVYIGWYNASNAGLKGLVDLKAGKLIVEPIYDELQGDFHEDLTAVAKAGKWGFMDRNAKPVIGLKYAGAGYFSEGAAPVWDTEGVKLIDKTGKVLAVKPQYIEARSAGYGFIAVKDKNGKWGMIDKTGKEIVKPQYVNLFNFNEYGLAQVMTGDRAKGYKHGWIGKDGKEVVKPQYDTTYDFGADGLAMVGKAAEGGQLKYGYIDKAGKEVVKPQYDYIYDAYQEGMKLVSVNGKYGFLAEPGGAGVPAER